MAARALILCAVGVYGVLCCSVTRRTREIGVRTVSVRRRKRCVAWWWRRGGMVSLIGVAAGSAGGRRPDSFPGESAIWRASAQRTDVRWASGVMLPVALRESYIPAGGCRVGSDAGAACRVAGQSISEALHSAGKPRQRQRCKHRGKGGSRMRHARDFGLQRPMQ